MLPGPVWIQPQELVRLAEHASRSAGALRRRIVADGLETSPLYSRANASEDRSCVGCWTALVRRPQSHRLG